jgi:phage shock protein PspC (stress-responsive transcriptional regulator)
VSQKNQYRCYVHVHGSGGGFFSRTVGGLARKFGVPRGVIIVGFIMLFIMSAPLALVTFIGAWYWIKNPGKLEAAVDGAMESARRSFRSDHTHEDRAQAAGAPAGAFDEDLDFSELRARFDELETRARRMEEHVSSDEYHLRKQFDDIQGDKDDRTRR